VLLAGLVDGPAHAAVARPVLRGPELEAGSTGSAMSDRLYQSHASASPTRALSLAITHSLMASTVSGWPGSSSHCRRWLSSCRISGIVRFSVAY
jgi:hypothetical protein